MNLMPIASKVKFSKTSKTICFIWWNLKFAVNNEMSDKKTKYFWLKTYVKWIIMLHFNYNFKGENFSKSL